VQFTAGNRDLYDADMGPIKKGCECYACVNHTRAYLSHLFVVGDLLGLTLVQLHNITQLEGFVEGFHRGSNVGGKVSGQLENEAN
jgi:tRNA-guanine family transglycosylase